MLFPFLVILPGMIALVATPFARDAAKITAGGRGAVGGGRPASPANRPRDHSRAVGPENASAELDDDGHVVLDYDLATPMMLLRFFPTGLLGLGLTALLASFMSGMAGNVTAFNTVWTYDIYQSHIKPDASDAHYLAMGRIATVVRDRTVGRGGLRGVGVQQHHGPAAARLRVRQRAALRRVRARHVLAAHHGARCVLGTGGRHAGRRAPPWADPSRRRQSRGSRAATSGICTRIRASCRRPSGRRSPPSRPASLVTVVVSLFTAPRPPEELRGLVYSLTPKPEEHDRAWYARPGVIAIGVLILTALLNLVFY